MLKRVVQTLGLVEHKGKDSRRKNHLRAESHASELYSRSNDDFAVRITHAGGYQEVYRHEFAASRLMRKYPGMCVARPEVFKVPNESVLWHEELLVPGHKYILISFKDVDKLKRKVLEEEKIKEANGVVLPNGGDHSHRENGKMKDQNGVLETRIVSPKGKEKSVAIETTRGVDEEMVDKTMESCVGEGEGVEEPFFSARDFYVHEKSTTTTTRASSRRKGIKGKKPFVPPLPNPRPYGNFRWQPSLPTVKELSP